MWTILNIYDNCIKEDDKITLQFHGKKIGEGEQDSKEVSAKKIVDLLEDSISAPIYYQIMAEMFNRNFSSQYLKLKYTQMIKVLED